MRTPRTEHHARTLDDGSIVCDSWTNDNRDDGTADDEASWTLTYRSRAMFDKCVGRSRVGWAGTVVDVTLDGVRL